MSCGIYEQIICSQHPHKQVTRQFVGKTQLEVLMGFGFCFSSLHLLLLQGNEVFYSRFETQFSSKVRLNSCYIF